MSAHEAAAQPHTQPQEEAGLATLPQELIEVVCLAADSKDDVVALAMTCRRLHACVFRSEAVWGVLTRGEFTMPDAEHSPDDCATRRVVGQLAFEELEWAAPTQVRLPAVGGKEGFRRLLELRRAFDAKVVVVRGSALEKGKGHNAVVVASNSELRDPMFGAMHEVCEPMGEMFERYVSQVAQGDLHPTTVLTTPPFGLELHFDYVVQAVGPAWTYLTARHVPPGGRSPQRQCVADLMHTYANVFALARRMQWKSIAVAGISTGARGFPLTIASAIAMHATVEALAHPKCTLEKVTFVCYEFPHFTSMLQARSVARQQLVVEPAGDAVDVSELAAAR